MQLLDVFPASWLSNVSIPGGWKELKGQLADLMAQPEAGEKRRRQKIIALIRRIDSVWCIALSCS
jgi:hypothetical protein